MDSHVESFFFFMFHMKLQGSLAASSIESNILKVIAFAYSDFFLHINQYSYIQL